MDDKHVPILVVAIDIGTTYSRFAYLFKSKCLASSDAKPVHWPNGQDKAPTVVLFNQNKVFDSFGYDAELKYSELVSEGEHEDWYFFQRFKLKLNERMDTEYINLSDACGKTMPACTVLAAVIQAMRVRMLELLEKKNTSIDDGDILWVFNVPGRWSGSAHCLLKKASHEAGIPDNKMMIVLDPVVASLFYDITLSEEAITPKYMVLDVGGGTIDITVLQKQNDGNITAVYHSSSKIVSLFGGLWLMLGDIVGQETLERLQKEYIMEYIQMERDFEIKTQYIHDTITVKAPVLLSKIHNNEQLNPKSGKFKVLGRKIRIDGGLFKEHLSVSVDKIGSLLNRAFEQPAVVGTRVCLMVGALSESDYLINSLKQKFPTLKLVSNKNAQFANVVGAAISGHRPNTVFCSIHNTVTDLPDSEPKNYSSHDTRETQGNSRTESIGKAIDSFICRSEKIDVFCEQRLNALKVEHCKALESLNACFHQALEEKQRQCNEHRSLYEEMQQLKEGFISEQKQLEEVVLAITIERDDFEKRATDSESKYNTILVEVTKLKQENQRLDENNQQLSLDVSRTQLQIAQHSETISSLQMELHVLKQDKKFMETSEKQLRCEIHSVRANLEKGQETLAKFVTENKNLKCRAVESEKKYRTVQAEVTKLKQDNQRIDKNNQKLSLDNSRAQFQVAQSSETISSLRKELDALKQDIKFKETLEEQMRCEIHSLRASVEEGQVTLAKLLTENENLMSRAVESEKKYRTVQADVTKLKQENQRIVKDNEKLSLDNSRAQFQVAQFSETISSLQNELDTLKQDRKLKETLEEQLMCEIHSLRVSAEKGQELLTENENLKSRLRESETRYTLMETQYMQAESKVDEKLHILQQMGLAVSQHAEMDLSFKQEISKLRGENKTLQQREKDLLAQIKMITGSEEKERRDNNKNAVSNSKDRSDTENADEVPVRIGEICNLSDPNRATSLCERFSDLFHEDWQKALECLTKSSFTQKEAVGCLLSVLQACFNSCKKASKTQIQILTRALLHPVGTLSESASYTAQSVQLRPVDLREFGSQSNHALLQLRRAIATHPSVVQQIKEGCAKEVNASSIPEHCLQWTQITFESCTPFIMKCAELCWLMCLLDPPLEMEFEFKQGKEINPKVYTLYPTSGQTADFLVWPPLYNSETGNIVAQGVAEAFTH